MSSQIEATSVYAPGVEDYANLAHYSELRKKELADMLAPVIDITDKYGVLICRVTNVLGNSPPASLQDKVVRDLMVDVFDFLWEWRRPLFEGRVQVAYPLARRAYESLSLLSICAQDFSYAERWENGKKISNSEIRKALAKAPMAESQDALRELYTFFSTGTHPNRDLIGYRFLGEGNQFVLGSIGMPDLVFVVDHCIKLVQMWFWFTASVGYNYRVIISSTDKSFGRDYLSASEEAQKAILWLIDNFNRLLREKQENTKV